MHTHMQNVHAKCVCVCVCLFANVRVHVCVCVCERESPEAVCDLWKHAPPYCEKTSLVSSTSSSQAERHRMELDGGFGPLTDHSRLDCGCHFAFTNPLTICSSHIFA